MASTRSPAPEARTARHGRAAAPADGRRAWPGWMALAFSALIVVLLAARGVGSAVADGRSPPSAAAAGPADAIGLQLSVDPPVAHVGQTVLLRWSASSASTCAASGTWSGVLPPAGERRVPVTRAGSLSFAVRCSQGTQDALARVTTLASAPGLELQASYTPRESTWSTSEGAPYGETDFWPERDVTVSNYGYGPTRVQRVYICLSGMVSMDDCSAAPTPTGPLSTAMLEGMDRRLARFAGSGKRLLVRFVYNLGPVGPQARDVPLPLILQHIDQLAPVLLKHRDRVFALQAGFVGTWGEWHGSTAGNLGRGSRYRVIERLLQHFGGQFPILLRYPGQMIEFLGAARTHPHLGLHNDYFASDATDGGTWAGYNNPTVSSAAVLKAYARDVAVRTMMVGEFGALDATRQACAALDAAAAQYRLQSFSLGVWPVEIGKALQGRGCAKTFFDKVGVRIELVQARVLVGAQPGSRTRVELVLRNAGYGRVLRPRPVTLLWLSGPQELARFAWPMEQLDLRQLQPGAQPTTFVIDVPSPPARGGAAAGRPPSLALWVPDPARSLHDDPAYALPLNSRDATGQEVFRPESGLNFLGSLMPVRSGSGS